MLDDDVTIDSLSSWRCCVEVTHTIIEPIHAPQHRLSFFPASYMYRATKRWIVICGFVTFPPVLMQY